MSSSSQPINHTDILFTFRSKHNAIRAWGLQAKNNPCVVYQPYLVNQCNAKKHVLSADSSAFTRFRQQVQIVKAIPRSIPLLQKKYLM